MSKINPRISKSVSVLGVGIVTFSAVSLLSGFVINPPSTPKVTVKHKAVTYAADIAPLVANHCLLCHRDNAGAPFPLTTYSQVKERGKFIVEVVSQKLMPPWSPGPSDFKFQNDRHLTDDQIQVFKAWAADGMQKGTSSTPFAVPKFVDGWKLGKPDLIVQMPKAFPVPSDGPDIYRNFVVPLHLNQDEYISAIDFRPSAPSVVHHSLFYYDSSGFAATLDGKDGKPGFGNGMGVQEVASHGKGGAGLLFFMDSGKAGSGQTFGGIGGWAVGAQPSFLPDSLSYFLPKGSDLILSTHFHLSGKAELERSTVGIYFAKTPPPQPFTALLMPPVFGALSNIDIPAGDKKYLVKDSFTLPVAVKAFGVGGHAHYLAKDMLMTATLPDGTKKTLIHIPNWDFNWQDQLNFSHDADLPAGTKLHVTISYDNTESNPRQPNNPPKEVTWGEQTTDEMGSIFLRLYPVQQSDMGKLKLAYVNHVRGMLKANRG